MLYGLKMGENKGLIRDNLAIDRGVIRGTIRSKIEQNRNYKREQKGSGGKGG